jgi:hypothetical protein
MGGGYFPPIAAATPKKAGDAMHWSSATGATRSLAVFGGNGRCPPLGEVPVRPLIGCADDIGTPICGHKSSPRRWEANANLLFQPLEENAGGVSEEEFALLDVTREHGIRGVTGLLPDLERGDTRPSRARREAGAKAVPREVAALSVWALVG